MSFITFYGRQVPIIYDVDCVVVGGGTAGAVAAIASLEKGIKTVVVEKTIALGGTQTNALVSPMMPTYVEQQSVNTLIIDRLQERNVETKDGETTCSWFNTEGLSYVLEQLIVERNGEILYDANFVDCIKDDDTITHILVNTCNGLVAIQGKTYIDATADAILSRTAGVQVASGNKDGENQQLSFRFEMGGIHIPTLRSYLLEHNETFCTLKNPQFFEIAMLPGKNFVLEPFFQKGLENGDLHEEDLRYFQGFTQPNKPTVMSFNCPHIPNIYHTTNPVLRSKAVTKGREMIHRLVAFLQKYVPGFENAYLLKEATQLGVRESYRIVGKYVLTEEDYVRRARFEDGIAKGDWYIDVHSVAKEHVEEVRFGKGEYYEIPYRSLITHEVSNLIVAGRHISSTFFMQASLRIQPTVRDIGQAAGEACAYVVKHGLRLNELDGSVLKGMAK